MTNEPVATQLGTFMFCTSPGFSVSAHVLTTIWAPAPSWRKQLHNHTGPVFSPWTKFVAYITYYCEATPHWTVQITNLQ